MFADLLNKEIKSSFAGYNVESIKIIGDTKPWTRGFITGIEPTRNVWEVQKAAGHDFTAEMKPVFTNINGQYIAIDDKSICVDAKTQKPLGNGVVGAGYTPTQPDELYQIADDLLKLDDSIMVTDFIKRDDNHFMGIQLNTGEWSPTHDSADILQNNITLFTSFDGSKVTGTKTSSFRVVCRNTFAMAKLIHSIKHTKNYKEKLNDLRRLLGINLKEIQATNQKIQRLVDVKMSNGQASQWFESLLLAGKDKPKEGRGLTVLTNNVNDFERLLLNGAGAESGKGTAYAAWNALTNYTTHERSTRVTEGAKIEDLRFESNLFGTSSVLAQRGFEQLARM